MGRILEYKGRLYIRWRDGHGMRHTKRVKCPRREAEKLLRQKQWEADQERLGVETTPQTEPPLEKLVEAFEDHVRTYRSAQTLEHYTIGLRMVLTFLRERGRRIRKARDLTLDDLRAFAAAKQAEGAAANTINGRLGAVRAMLNWAVREGKLAANPVRKWRPLRGPKRRPRRALSVVEIAKLFKHSPPHLADLWLFALGTGLRAGELAGLEEHDIDWTGKAIGVRAETSKSKRGRTIPLRDDLLPLLRRQLGRRAALPRPDGHEHLVWTNTVGKHWGKELPRRLKPCLKAANLDGTIDLHTLRHTFGSHLIANGVDVKTVQALLGHAQLSTTVDIYAHELGTSRRRDAVATLTLPALEPAAEPARTWRAAAGGP